MSCTLRATSAFTRELILLDGSSQIGSISPEGLVGRRAIVDLPDEMPLPVRIFITWLALRLWDSDTGLAD
jgi:hypothetical protein